MWPILSLTILGFLSLAQTCMVEKTNATPRSPRRGKISFHFIVNNSDEPYSVFSFQINSQHVQIPLSDVSSLSCFSPNLTAGYVSKWSHLIKISWYAQWSKQAQKICLADSGIDGHGSLPPYWTPSKCSTTERWRCLFQKGFFLTRMALVLCENWQMGFKHICYMQTYNQEVHGNNWFWRKSERTPLSPHRISELVAKLRV